MIFHVDHNVMVYSNSIGFGRYYTCLLNVCVTHVQYKSMRRPEDNFKITLWVPVVELIL